MLLLAHCDAPLSPCGAHGPVGCKARARASRARRKAAPLCGGSWSVLGDGQGELAGPWSLGSSCPQLSATDCLFLSFCRSRLLQRAPPSISWHGSRQILRSCAAGYQPASQQQLAASKT
jgi:hypothetical protein